MFRDFMEGNPDESSHGDPVAFVTSENASRRHLNTSQLAHAIAAMAGWERAQAKKRQAAAGGDKKSLCAGLHEAVIEDKGRTSEKLAAKTGVSARTVDKAIKVREAGIPEVNQAVASGEVSLNMAEKIVKLSPAAQRRVIDTPAKDRADALQTAFVLSDAAKRSCIRLAAMPSTLQRTSSDKRHAVMLLLTDDEWAQWSNKEIARRCRVDASTVDKYRLEVTRSLPDSGSEKAKKTYTNKHGTTSTMNTENIGMRRGGPSKSPEPSSGSGDALNCDTDAKTAQGRVKYYPLASLGLV